MKEEQRLMMSEEEVRERAKELLNMPREELLTNHLFLQQENQRLEEVIKEAREYVIDELLDGTLEWHKRNYTNISGSDLPNDCILKIIEILDKEYNEKI